MKTRLFLFVVVMIVLISGCAGKAANPNNALIRAEYIRTNQISARFGIKSVVVSITDDNGKAFTVDHGLFMSNFIEVPPGKYSITYACVPRKAISKTEIHKHLNTYGNSGIAKTDTVILASGEMIRPDYRPGTSNCSLNLVHCKGICNKDIP